MSTANVPSAGTTEGAAIRFVSLEEQTKGTTWLSTRPELPKLLIGDVVTGTTVSFFISPFVAMVDQAIVQRSMGTHTIMSSVQSTMKQMLHHPAMYFRSTPFLWMWALYTATYSTANTLKTLQEEVHRKNQAVEKATQKPMILCTSPAVSSYSTIRFQDPTGHSHSGSFTVDQSRGSFSWLSAAASTLLASPLCLLVGTSSVNISMSLLKDRAYAHLFAKQEPNITNRKPPAVPLLTYGLWTVRDFMVVGSSFLIPDMVVKHSLKHGYIDHSQKDKTLRTAQFLIPVASQVLAGPLHLLGLNLYERPGIAVRERLRCFENGALTSVIAARMSRIIPAFSVGGVGNTYARDQWRQWVRTA